MDHVKSRKPAGKTAGVTPWMIAAIEGASTLAVEVIAIRLAVPVVGSSAALTGIMLGIVLLALSGGYWHGGVLSSRWDRRRMEAALMRNLLLAALLYGVVSFPLEAPLLEKLLDSGVDLPLAIGLAAIVLLAPPIYLASQTVPLLAELTNREGKAGKASGKVLFFSTLGSVAGGIVTPIWMFPTIGVQRSGEAICLLLTGAACLAGWQRLRPAAAAGLGAATVVAVMSIHLVASPAARGFFFDSAYQTFHILPEDRDGRATRTLVLSGSRASGVYADTGATSFSYVLEAERALGEVKPTRVLVVGAAGFTFPRDVARSESVERIDAVDVDPAVERIAETEFLRETLSPKIRFLPLSARYALRRMVRDRDRYGFTMVDAYYGKGIPEELVTFEFFRDLAQVSDRICMNVILDPDLTSRFASGMLATARQAFGTVWVKPALKGDFDMTNIMVTNWPTEGSMRWTGSGPTYRDDRSTANLDWVRLIRGADGG
jgi:hypothetical protein